MLSPNPEQKKAKPQPVDIHVGRRIRMGRVWKGMSQISLAEQIGVTFQQVQKYEKGINRVGASRLQQIAEALEVAVSYFFEDVPGGGTNGVGSGAVKSLQPGIIDFASSKEGLALIRAFSRIGDANVRSRAISLLKAIADGID
ncbi:helix-turn-helix domain-containing protein [Sinorhizobium prairiense]|uniref:helix-turn-helix domain-containing protein n=1 Tax=unclassified Sinorhizobium TaxID=2613772 RepID=UPI0023D84720|nr:MULTISPECIES: helix-turn-helix transcriptional regulator [unclassified Sinorhizobium]WEJ08661.1 helix-turn-helix transcriptional regulator [Sinorhizobium sp. M103]WEJ13838.1 helix-turn-helix transcriptional regulator [Sinorhizobium sp. K101]WEJ35434.1 helix-turn-helix transcriptional regulator [Sinorhizobium sp. C101]